MDNLKIIAGVTIALAWIFQEAIEIGFLIGVTLTGIGGIAWLVLR